MGKCWVPQLFETSNLTSRLGNILGFFLQSLSGFTKKQKSEFSISFCPVR